MAALLESLSTETESKDVIRGLLTAIGLLAYGATLRGEVVEVCEAMGGKGIVEGKKGWIEGLGKLVGEVVQVVA